MSASHFPKAPVSGRPVAGVHFVADRETLARACGSVERPALFTSTPAGVTCAACVAAMS